VKRGKHDEARFPFLYNTYDEPLLQPKDMPTVTLVVELGVRILTGSFFLSSQSAVGYSESYNSLELQVWKSRGVQAWKSRGLKVTKMLKEQHSVEESPCNFYEPISLILRPFRQ
jgi:hypothetical protein